MDEWVVGGAVVTGVLVGAPAAAGIVFAWFMWKGWRKKKSSSVE